MTQLVTLKQIAEKLGISEDEVAKRAQREGWPIAGVLSSTTISKNDKSFTVHSYKKTSAEDKA